MQVYTVSKQDILIFQVHAVEYRYSLKIAFLKCIQHSCAFLLHWLTQQTSCISNCRQFRTTIFDCQPDSQNLKDICEVKHESSLKEPIG